MKAGKQEDVELIHTGDDEDRSFNQYCGKRTKFNSVPGTCF